MRLLRLVPAAFAAVYAVGLFASYDARVVMQGLIGGSLLALAVVMLAQRQPGVRVERDYEEIVCGVCGEQVHRDADGYYERCDSCGSTDSVRVTIRGRVIS